MAIGKSKRCMKISTKRPRGSKWKLIKGPVSTKEAACRTVKNAKKIGVKTRIIKNPRKDKRPSYSVWAKL